MHRLYRNRITPACAGKHECYFVVLYKQWVIGGGHFRSCLTRWDYPRVCDNTLLTIFAITISMRITPRVWENRSIVGSIPDDAGIIPACARKISFMMLA